MQSSNNQNHFKPTDAIVADIVNGLDENLREDFEERSAIIEFEAKVPRAHAECLALIDLLRRHPEVLIDAGTTGDRSGTAQS